MKSKAPAKETKVVVVHDGSAELHAAQAASTRGARVTHVDCDGRHDFIPRLAAMAGGTAPASCDPRVRGSRGATEMETTA